MLLSKKANLNVTVYQSIFRYDAKPPKNYARGYEFGSKNFTKKTLTLEEFAQGIRAGYPFCPFNRSQKNVSDGDCTNMIIIDMDWCQTTMEEALNLVSYTPTIAYKSYSDDTTVDGVWKGYRYRFIYVFDEEFCGQDYEVLYKLIADENELEEIGNAVKGQKCVDFRTYNQFYFGTSHEVITSGIIYRLPDLNNCPTIDDNDTDGTNVRKGKESPKTPQIPQSDSVLMKEYWVMPIQTWSFKYNEECNLPDLRESKWVECDDERILLPADHFLKIQRQYRYDTTSGNHYLCKYTDGQGRRRRLYTNGLIYKRLCEEEGISLTKEDLLVWIVAEALTAYDNSDGVLTKKVLKDIADGVFDSDSSKLSNYTNHSGYKVNDEYCAKERVTKRQVVGMVTGSKMKAKKEKKYEDIKKYFNAELSDKENLKVLMRNGVKISRETFQRFKKSLKS